MSEHSYDALFAGFAHQDKIEETEKDNHHTATDKPKGCSREAAKEYGRQRDMKNSQSEDQKRADFV